MSTTTLAPETNLRKFIISRTYNASRDVVWKAVTEPSQMEKWLSPKGCSSRAVKLDLRPGGTYLYCMTTPDGHEMWGKMDYLEITAPERLVYINAFSNAEGGTIRHPMSKSWPLHMHSTFDLTEKDGHTTLTITWMPQDGSPEEIATFETSHEGMKQGWTGTLDNLAAYLQNK